MIYDGWQPEYSNRSSKFGCLDLSCRSARDARPPSRNRTCCHLKSTNNSFFFSAMKKNLMCMSCTWPARTTALEGQISSSEFLSSSSEILSIRQVLMVCNYWLFSLGPWVIDRAGLSIERNQVRFSHIAMALLLVSKES